MSHGALATFLKQDRSSTPYDRTLDQIEHWALRQTGIVSASRPSDRAAELLRALDHPEFVRRVAGKLSVRDRIAAAYAIAIDDRFTPEEMRQLDAWRDRLLADEAESR